MNKYTLYATDGVNKIIIKETDKIEDMDNYTKEFVGYKDIICHGAGIKDDDNYKLYLENKYKDKVENIDIMTCYDELNLELIKEKYYELLNDNRELIKKSPIQYVKLGYKITPDISSNDLLFAIKVYLNPKSYKKIRDTYFLLCHKKYIKRTFDNSVILLNEPKKRKRVFKCR